MLKLLTVCKILRCPVCSGLACFLPMALLHLALPIVSLAATLSSCMSFDMELIELQ